ncbi:hypothetical protein KIH41_10575 [Litoribacter ruber]|uniref:hypothetical protein n=1 Tax=Litoribacter ruber TaxID=702568 RepID=UPI001BDB3DFD|nr:hypothetical protein [Litoribacter ruber]MBT0811720.1 hypothetical protein [Litoribacter ruber]
MKKLLIATNHLKSIGGTEVYTYYFIKSLIENENYEVEYFTFQRGLVSKKIEKDLKVPYMQQESYDLIIASHYSTVAHLYGKGPIIQISHGMVPPLEQPSPLANAYVSISEEIRHHLEQEGFPSQVVLNGVDLSVFSSKRSLNPTVQTILSLCQSEEANELIKQVCESMGIEFIRFNKNVNPTFDLSEEINKADLVIGIGRSAYDAMACGRPCIIFDYRHYNGNRGDGYLMPEDFKKYVQFNCSGRYKNQPFDSESLSHEIEKYNPKHGEQLRALAVRYLSVKTNSRQILKIGKTLLGETEMGEVEKVFLYLKHRKHFKRLKRDLRESLSQRLKAGETPDSLLRQAGELQLPLPLKLALKLYLRKQKGK